MTTVTSGRENGGSTLWKALTSSSAQTSLLMMIVIQTMTMAYFQVVNNEQQAAAIKATEVSIKDFRDQVVNLQTPLGHRVLKLEDRIDEIWRMREVRNSQVKQLEDQLSRLAERLILVDRKLFEIEVKVLGKQPPQQ